MVSRNPPWADLPQELLSTIANFLTSNPISILTFRSICHSWRSSCPPLSNSPLLSHLLPLSIPSSSYHSFDDSSSSSILSVTIIYALRRPLYLSEGQVSSLSPDAWILFVDEFTPVQELVTCGNNCILFTKHSFLSYSWNNDDNKDFPKFKKHDLDVGVYHLHNADDFGAIGSYRGYSDTLWPPPCWIWPIDRLKRIEIVETVIDEILDRIPDNFKNKLERPADSFDAAGQIRFLQAAKVALEAGQDALNLRARVEKFHEEETEFMHNLRESMKSLNKVDMLFEQSGTSSQGTTKETPGLPDNFKTSPTCQDGLLRSTMSTLRKRDACLFSIEEQTTKVKMYLNSLLGPILTQ